MKSYPANLLDAWPDDRGPAVLPDRPAARALFPRLHSETAAALAWITDTVRTVKEQEDAVFDRLYRRGHVPCGLAALLGLPKVTHVLAVLDFALDLGRSLQTFERHSLNYVVSLLAMAAQGVCDDFLTTGRSERDLTDVIDECRTYLAELLRQSLAAASSRGRSPRSQVRCQSHRGGSAAGAVRGVRRRSACGRRRTGGVGRTAGQTWLD